MNARILPPALAVACALLAWRGNAYALHLGVTIALGATVALSVQLMLRMGQMSFAQAAFMGMGAYGSALLSMRLGMPPALAFVCAGLIPAAVALAVGPLFLRVKGVYFVLLTFAFSQIVNLVFQEWVGLFGGNSGLYGIPRFAIAGITVTSVGGYFALALALAVASCAVCVAIQRSDIGAVLACLRANEALGSALGLNALRWRTGIFALSAGMAGLAGSLYAHYLSFISPVAFAFSTTVDGIVMNVVGGMASPLGPVVGAALLVPLPELLRDARQYQLLAYAVLLMVVLLWLPGGIVGGLFRTGQRDGASGRPKARQP